MQRRNRGVAAALWGAAGVWLCACSARAAVVATWNFNALTGAVPPILTADVGGGTASLADFTGGLGTLAGTDLNALPGDTAGQGLVITGSGQNGRAIVLEVSTLGLEDLALSVAARRSSSGFTVASVEAWDGAAWQRAGFFDASTTQWQVHAFSLSGMTFLRDSASARLRLKLEGATTGSGNLRLDNLRLEGTPVPGPGPAAAIGAAMAAASSRRGGRSRAVRKDETPHGAEVRQPDDSSVGASADQRGTPPSSVPGSATGARRSPRARSGRASG